MCPLLFSFFSFFSFFKKMCVWLKNKQSVSVLFHFGVYFFFMYFQRRIYFFFKRRWNEGKGKEIRIFHGEARMRNTETERERILMINKGMVPWRTFCWLHQNSIASTDSHSKSRRGKKFQKKLKNIKKLKMFWRCTAKYISTYTCLYDISWINAQLQSKAMIDRQKKKEKKKTCGNWNIVELFLLYCTE